MRRFFSFETIIPTILVLLVLKFLPVFFEIDFLNPIESTLDSFHISDMYFSDRNNDEDIKIDSNIVLVNIGLLERRDVAIMLDIIGKYNPAVIGVDAMFESEKGLLQDIPLAWSLENQSSVVQPVKLSDYNPFTRQFDSVEKSFYFFSEHGTKAFANLIVSPDNFRTVRQFSVRENAIGDEYFFFPVEIVRSFDSLKFKRFMQRGNQLEVINYKRNVNKYITLDTREVYRRKDSLGFIEGKIVIIGFLGPDIITPTDEDIFFTPLNTSYVGKSHPDMYGITIHANVISMLLEEDYIEVVPEWISIAGMILVIHLNIVFLSWLRRKTPGMYEPISIAMGIAEIAFFFLLIFAGIYFFQTKIYSGGIFFALLLYKQAYEIYNYSLTPIFWEIIRKIISRVSD